MVRRKALAQRIRQEINDLEQTVSIVVRHWQRIDLETGDQDAFLNSVALNVHSFYNCFERLMELIAVEMDGGKLGGAMWHSELIRQMALELPAVRPAVLTTETGNYLDEYRKFRHRIRNIYATHLEASRMEHLVTALPSVWQQARTELLGFADFLERLEENG